MSSSGFLLSIDGGDAHQEGRRPRGSLDVISGDARARICSFFWIQSMVRDDAERTLLFDLDAAIQQVSRELPGHSSAVQLTGIYHNLLRRWADL